MRHCRFSIILLAVAAGWSSIASSSISAGDLQSRYLAQANPPAKTGKERLSGKAADRQRVNDCKVPLDKRGDKKRPAACPWEQPKKPDS